ncbi:Flp family type IVb pilin [Ancylobacter pratisalsi]|uniref:Flp family type IVb pilin n=1 Tax=Ancylobacter pratisalsi TaxID=1745854 RepID=A0A6P1YSM5_9HYPH|nr:hypothetical protein [Ancylobacter pratisalsi]QIB36507.1 hypothetical protein G3A50_22065 [Ancylobacter pratisalsi]
MTDLPAYARRLLRDDAGAATLEYGLVIIAVVLIAAGAISLIAGRYDEPLNEAAQEIVTSRESLSNKP